MYANFPKSMLFINLPSPKTECGRLWAGKLKAVTYAYTPRHKENAEEEEGRPASKDSVYAVAV